MIGFHGLTVLVDTEPGIGFQRLRQIARRQRSCAEWVEENGRRFLHVTYPFSELESFSELLRAAAGHSGKRLFVNGLEVRWPTGRSLRTFYAQMHALAEPEADLDDKPLSLDTRYPVHLELQN